MPLHHLIKLCVGCDFIADLEDWIEQKFKEKKRRGQKLEHIHTTRMVPKRAEELIAGGSLYWVIRGQISCREKILAICPFTDKDGIGRCRVVLDGKLGAGRAAPALGLSRLALSRAKDAPRDLVARRRAAPPKCAEQMRRGIARNWGCSRRPRLDLIRAALCRILAATSSLSRPVPQARRDGARAS